MEGSVRWFENPATGKEDNEASELEMADRIHRENLEEQYNKKVLEESIEAIKKEYLGFVDNMEVAKRDIEIQNASELEISRDKTGNRDDASGKELADFDSFEKMVGADFKFEEIKKYINEKMPILIEKIKTLYFEPVAVNSLKAVLTNSIMRGMNRSLKLAKNIDRHYDDAIMNPDSNLRKGARILNEVFSPERIIYYIDELCSDSDKLKIELTSAEGYLGRFEEFFFDTKGSDLMNKNYPRGGDKLPYFRFFSELEKGSINKENLEEELGKLEEKDQSGSPVIDKGKIRLKFRN